jgi:hypothetical protein
VRNTPSHAAPHKARNGIPLSHPSEECFVGLLVVTWDSIGVVAVCSVWDFFIKRYLVKALRPSVNG